MPITLGTSSRCQSCVITTCSAASSISANAQLERLKYAANFAPTICIISSRFVHSTISWLIAARNARFISARLRCVTSRETLSRRAGLPSSPRIGVIATSHHFGVPSSVRKHPTKLLVLSIIPAAADATAHCAATRSSPAQKSSHDLFINGRMSSIPSSACPLSKDSKLPSRSSTLIQSGLLLIMLRLNDSLSRRVISARLRSVQSSCTITTLIGPGL